MGNCCAKLSKKKSKIHSKDTSEAPAISKPMTPSKYRSLKVDSPFDHCNLLVWSQNPEDFYQTFPQTFYKHQVAVNKEMSFNISPFHTYSSQCPFVVDALIFIIQDQSEFETCKSIASSFHNICIKAIISEVQLEDYEGFFKIPHKDLLWGELYEQQKNLAKMLRELFTDIDTDFSNFITFEEFFEAIGLLNHECSIDMARTIMKEIDKDNNGKISFNEFCYWWKRGRQGKTSILQLTSEWADKIRYILPKMNDFTENSQINKKKSKKRLSFVSKSKAAPRFCLDFKAGKSGKREEILHKIEEKLTLNIYESWITFVITAKTDEKARERLKLFEETVNNLQLCLISNSSNIKFWDSFTIETSKIGDKIFLSIIIDTEADHLSDLVSKLDSLDRSLTSPIDDFLSISFKSELSVKDLVSKPSSEILDSIRLGSLEILSEHWSAYKSMKTSETEFGAFMEKFLKIEGEKVLSSDDLARLLPVASYLRQTFSPVSRLISQVPMLYEALKVFNEDFKPSLSIFARYMNLGCEFSVEGEDLASLFIN